MSDKSPQLSSTESDYRFEAWHIGRCHLVFLEPEVAILGQEVGAGEGHAMQRQTGRCGTLGKYFRCSPFSHRLLYKQAFQKAFQHWLHFSDPEVPVSVGGEQYKFHIEKNLGLTRPL